MGKIMLNGVDYSAPVEAAVSGVKGNAESTYRTGNVNLTPANIGALANNGNSQNVTTTFTSSDVADGSATSWTSVTPLASGETHSSIFAKVSQMFKNIRYLYKALGTTNISTIGDGSVKGAISTINSSLNNIPSIKYYDVAYTYNQGVAAGSAGYSSVNIPTNIEFDKIVSVETLILQVSDSKGLQLTPIYALNGTLYINYFFPQSNSSNITVTVRVWYFD